MKSEVLNIKGVCFGEVLWDNLPTGRKLGGAPLNVAYHLNKLGIHTDMLTRVGADPDGEAILKQCEELAIPITLFQQDTVYPTSTVEVHIDEKRDVRYDIVFPVAWDNMSVAEDDVTAVGEADFFVFGSLSTRHITTYKALQKLLQVAKYKVLDVNLRAPHYTKERIFELLQLADLVKMNEEELEFVANWLDIPNNESNQGKVETVMHVFKVDELIVTYGAKGAIYHCLSGKFSYHFPAWKVEVKDTIGSGDSFLAAFLSQRCRPDRLATPEEMLEFATTLSAFVTQSTGACPSYDAPTINRFMWLKALRETGY